MCVHPCTFFLADVLLSSFSLPYHSAFQSSSATSRLVTTCRYAKDVCTWPTRFTECLLWRRAVSCVTSHLPQSFATRHFEHAQKQKQEEKSCRIRSCKSEANTQNPAKAECRAISSFSHPLERGRVDSNVCPALLPASVRGLLTSIAIFWDFLYIDRWGLELEAREIHVFVREREIVVRARGRVFSYMQVPVSVC